MPVRLPTPFPAHPGSFGLVAASALFGVIACAGGTVGWSLTGLGVGLLASWLLFLFGLAGLYQRERRGLAAAPAQAEALASQADWETTAVGR